MLQPYLRHALLCFALTVFAGITGSDAGASDPIARMVAQINAVRKAHNVSPVAANALLMRAAQDHTNDMVRNDLFDHRGSNGSRVGDRLKGVEFKYKLAVENISGGLESPEATVRHWLDSAAHRRNLLNPNMCRVGVGYAHDPQDGGKVTYKHYWTMVLARPPGPFCLVK